MTVLPTPVVVDDDAHDLGELFPSFYPEPEKLVYEHVHDATRTRIVFPADGLPLTLPLEFSEPPALSFDAKQGTTWDQSLNNGFGDETPTIPVYRAGGLAYPGQVPGIAVHAATESPDESDEATSGGFAGDAYAYSPLTFPADGSGLTFPDNAAIAQGHGEGIALLGPVYGTAAYFYEPLTLPVIVELIHENRDERDRLHMELHRILRPLTNLLPGLDPLIHKVRVTGDKQDVPVDEAPYVVYASVFTVEVWFQALYARDVAGAESAIQTVTTTVVPDPTIPVTPEE